MLRSISSRLALLFVLTILSTLLLGAVALWQETESARIANDNARNLRDVAAVERVNGLVYAAVMDSRGIYMSQDHAGVEKFAKGLVATLDRLSAVLASWDQDIPPTMRAAFDKLRSRAMTFRSFRLETVRLGLEDGPAAARKQGDNDANREVRTQLNKDLEAYARDLDHEATELAREGRNLVWIGQILTVITLLIVLLVSTGGMWFSYAKISRPIVRLVARMNQISSGNLDIDLHPSARTDEIGNLTTAVLAYREAVLRSSELQSTVTTRIGEREARQATLKATVDRFDTDARTVFGQIQELTQSMANSAES
jgi:methyl-accepting chemotaxis protein